LEPAKSRSRAEHEISLAASGPRRDFSPRDTAARDRSAHKRFVPILTLGQDDRAGAHPKWKSTELLGLV
jgi:hypothetical protein